MMYIDLKINNTIKIGDVTIKLLDKSGRLSRLAIDAPKDCEITLHKTQQNYEHSSAQR